MFHKLTSHVYWGNWQSASEAPVRSIINVSQNQRRRYFNMLRSLDQTIPYYRLGRADGKAVDEFYCESLADIVECLSLRHLPVLVHCVAGGHRSPAAAIFVAWHLSERSAANLATLRDTALALQPTMRVSGPYHRSLMEFCENNSR